MKRAFRIALIGLLALAAAVTLGSADALVRAYRATALLSLLSDDGAPETAAPASTLSFAVENEALDADLYAPQAEPQAGILLVPGLSPEGKRDPRLVRLAHVLSQVGFLAMVPEIPNFRALRAEAADGKRIAAALERLRAILPEAPLGIFALSYAAGPTLISAVDDTAKLKPDFAILVGGYYDIEAVIAFFTTGYFRDPGGEGWRWMQPNAYGKWVFVASNADRLASSEDAERLRAIAARKMRDEEADVSDLRATLGEAGQAVLAIIDNDDPRRTGALISALPVALRDELAALDPKQRDLAHLSTRLILVHGRNDAIIPYSQSAALARAAGEDRARLFLLETLDHVDIVTNVRDSLTAWRIAYRLLSERDRPQPSF